MFITFVRFALVLAPGCKRIQEFPLTGGIQTISSERTVLVRFIQRQLFSDSVKGSGVRRTMGSHAASGYPGDSPYERLIKVNLEWKSRQRTWTSVYACIRGSSNP
jgi:hypothetical protein